MSENIVKRIKEAEKEAEERIHEAEKKGASDVSSALKRLEVRLVKFREGSYLRLKKFREERTAYYKREAERIGVEGAKAREGLEKEIVKRLPYIKDKVARLVREELCL